MLNRALCVLLIAASAASGQDSPPAPCVGNWDASSASWRPLSLRQVRLGGFLGKHVDANNRVSLLEGLKSPIPAAFDAKAAGRTPPDACKRLATDSDFYKWLEGACYAVAYEPSLTELAAEVNRYSEIMVRLQEPDGYLGTRISPAEPFDRKVRHDLYCAGHFIEAAVARYNTSGRRDLLDAAVRLADFYLKAWKNKHPYYEIVGTQEHAEIELALARLYRATGEPRFLEFGEAVTRMTPTEATLAKTRDKGGSLHAVRLCYLLTGATEHYMQTGKEDLFRYVPGLWKEIAATRMYITGGIGYNERVPPTPYDLPQTLLEHPSRDIAETCASVSFMMLSWRLNALSGEAEYFDTIETVLYNHYLGAIAQDHLANFYYNPLRRTGDLSGKTDHGADPVRRCRLPRIHSTACCLPNSWRFFGELPEYVFSRRGDEIRINLYSDATANHVLENGTNVRVKITTAYPHDGRVQVRLEPDKPSVFAVGLRVPAWCSSASVEVTSSQTEDADPTRQPVPAGYHTIRRKWSAGDTIALDLPMQPVVVTSHPAVAANAGQVAFRRGPLVYCLEREDASGLDLDRLAVVLDATDPARSVGEKKQADMNLLTVPARATAGDETPALYRAAPNDAGEMRAVTLVPFYFRANRDDDPRWITWIPAEVR